MSSRDWRALKRWVVVYEPVIHSIGRGDNTGCTLITVQRTDTKRGYRYNGFQHEKLSSTTKDSDDKEMIGIVARECVHVMYGIYPQEGEYIMIQVVKRIRDRAGLA